MTCNSFTREVFSPPQSDVMCEVEEGECRIAQIEISKFLRRLVLVRDFPIPGAGPFSGLGSGRV